MAQAQAAKSLFGLGERKNWDPADRAEAVQAFADWLSDAFSLPIVPALSKPEPGTALAFL